MTVTIYTPNGSGIYNLDTLDCIEEDYVRFTLPNKDEMIAYIGLTLENLNELYKTHGLILKHTPAVSWKHAWYLTQDTKQSNENNRKES